mgnify:CR=1 FL=1
MPLSPTELRELEAELERLEALQSDLLDRSSNALTRRYAERLEEVQAEARRALRDSEGGDALELAQARLQVLGGAEAPLRALWAAWRDDLDEMLDLLGQYHGLLGADLPVDRSTIEVLRGVWPSDRLPDGLVGQLYRLDEVAKSRVADVLTRSVIGRLPRDQAYRAMAEAADRSVPRAKQLVHDGTMAFSRQVTALRTQDYEWFAYAGPKDEATRTFCNRLVGKILSRQEIDELDNGQTPDVFLTGGGYRCRHVWRPVRRDWYDDAAWAERRP